LPDGCVVVDLGNEVVVVGPVVGTVVVVTLAEVVVVVGVAECDGGLYFS
jgi:hypothetical protein